MQTIEIDFQVFKALTAMREDESITYNDVIRRLLDLAPVTKANGVATAAAGLVAGLAAGLYLPFQSRGLELPHGTLLRATYKGRQLSARVDNGRWIDSEGRQHASPSAAAKSVTNTNVNGLRFWEAQLPGASNWQKLEFLVGK